MLVPLALVILLGLHWWWRRRGPPLPSGAATTLAPRLTGERIAAWLAAGESRLALDHLVWAVRDREDFAEWRARAAALRFAPGTEAEVADLVHEGWSRLALAQLAS